jgi:hypothetical protein
MKTLTDRDFFAFLSSEEDGAILITTNTCVKCKALFTKHPDLLDLDFGKYEVSPQTCEEARDRLAAYGLTAAPSILWKRGTFTKAEHFSDPEKLYDLLTGKDEEDEGQAS